MLWGLGISLVLNTLGWRLILAHSIDTEITNILSPQILL